ncbi:hypothetical protein P7K49_013324 [Saguinus oedipus]|uniref:TRAF3-interacting protein 1 C-terminal domain-containing protein n=1 Tax=Saguinus oedipus TaxID=9490 RepID=A0ABQ9VGY6_SAGOE|nr:hypothetical protein P7K49_013324 [Saguinus oedipus]
MSDEPLVLFSLSITDCAVEPLKAELAELEQLIKDQQDKICAVKANVLRNEDKIQKMVYSVNSTSRSSSIYKGDFSAAVMDIIWKLSWATSSLSSAFYPGGPLTGQHSSSGETTVGSSEGLSSKDECCKAEVRNGDAGQIPRAVLVILREAARNDGDGCFLTLKTYSCVPGHRKPLAGMDESGSPIPSQLQGFPQCPKADRLLTCPIGEKISAGVLCSPTMTTVGSFSPVGQKTRFRGRLTAKVRPKRCLAFHPGLCVLFMGLDALFLKHKQGLLSMVSGRSVWGSNLNRQ